MIVQQLINGISLGAMYALLALGLAIVVSIMHLVNFAHGEVITASAYAMLGASYMNLPWPVIALIGVLAGPAIAVIMERVAFRPIRHAPPTTMLLTSFGVSLIIQALVRILVSPRNKALPQPSWMTSSVNIGGILVQNRQILSLVVAGIALAILVFLLRRTTLGIAMRAAAEDFDTTRLMGIGANGVIRLAFIISGLLAGIAAVLYVAGRGTVSPDMGFEPLLKAFVASVIGGLGSLPGAVAGGLILGIVEVQLQAWLPPELTGFVDGFVFLGLGILLLVRPQGIFGTKLFERV